MRGFWRTTRVQQLCRRVGDTPGKSVRRMETQQGLDFGTNVRSDLSFRQNAFPLRRREVDKLVKQETNLSIHGCLSTRLRSL